MGTDRPYRLWRREGLQVPKKRPRRRVATSRPRPQMPTAMNHMWAYDFVFDTCADGRTLKCLTVIDEFTRECLAIDVASGIRSGRVIEILAQLVSVHGAPQHLRSDNGPEFVATAILRWLQAAQIETAFLDPITTSRSSETTNVLQMSPNVQIWLLRNVLKSGHAVGGASIV